MTDHQLTETDLETMTPAEVNAARRDGRLATMLGQDPTTADALRRASAGERMTLEDLHRLRKVGRNDLANQALRDHRVDTQARPTTD